MNGTNEWDSMEYGKQPQYLSALAGIERSYKYVLGCLRWAIVERGVNSYSGFVLCYPDGEPITYADAGDPGSIRVSASGTYMTQ